MSFATLVRPTRHPTVSDVSVSDEAGTTVVTLRGEADIATLPALVDTLARIIADHLGDVVVDMAQIEFIDTATVRALLRAREALGRDGRQLTLRSPSKIAARLIALFGLSYLVGPERTAGR